MVAKRQNREQNCILKIIFVTFLKCRNGYIKYVHNSIYKGQNLPENEEYACGKIVKIVSKLCNPIE
jgi:hypothetical protein